MRVKLPIFTVLWVNLLLPLSLAAAMNHIMLHNPYARATFPMATTAAVYVTVMNHGEQAATLIGASVAPDIAAQAQIHTTVMDGEMMKMRQVTNGIVIQPDEMVELKPGSYHIMLMGLVNALEKGHKFNLTLEFADGAEQIVEVVVGEQGGQSEHHHH